MDFLQQQENQQKKVEKLNQQVDNTTTATQNSFIDKINNKITNNIKEKIGDTKITDVLQTATDTLGIGKSATEQIKDNLKAKVDIAIAIAHPTAFILSKIPRAIDEYFDNKHPEKQEYIDNIKNHINKNIKNTLYGFEVDNNNRIINSQNEILNGLTIDEDDDNILFKDDNNQVIHSRAKTRQQQITLEKDFTESELKQMRKAIPRYSKMSEQQWQEYIKKPQTRTLTANKYLSDKLAVLQKAIPQQQIKDWQLQKPMGVYEYLEYTTAINKMKPELENIAFKIRTGEKLNDGELETLNNYKIREAETMFRGVSWQGQLVSNVFQNIAINDKATIDGYLTHEATDSIFSYWKPAGWLGKLGKYATQTSLNFIGTYTTGKLTNKTFLKELGAGTDDEQLREKYIKNTLQLSDKGEMIINRDYNQEKENFYKYQIKVEGIAETLSEEVLDAPMKALGSFLDNKLLGETIDKLGGKYNIYQKIYKILKKVNNIPTTAGTTFDSLFTEHLEELFGMSVKYLAKANDPDTTLSQEMKEYLSPENFALSTANIIIAGGLFNKFVNSNNNIREQESMSSNIVKRYLKDNTDMSDKEINDKVDILAETTKDKLVEAIYYKEDAKQQERYEKRLNELEQRMAKDRGEKEAREYFTVFDTMVGSLGLKFGKSRWDIINNYFDIRTYDNYDEYENFKNTEKSSNILNQSLTEQQRKYLNNLNDNPVDKQIIKYLKDAWNDSKIAKEKGNLGYYRDFELDELTKMGLEYVKDDDEYIDHELGEYQDWIDEYIEEKVGSEDDYEDYDKYQEKYDKYFEKGNDIYEKKAKQLRNKWDKIIQKIQDKYDRGHTQREEKYKQKTENIKKAVERAEQLGYNYGKKDGVIYFDLPNGRQISFHDPNEEIKIDKEYKGEWNEFKTTQNPLTNTTEEYKQDVINLIKEQNIKEIKKLKDSNTYLEKNPIKTEFYNTAEVLEDKKNKLKQLEQDNIILNQNEDDNSVLEQQLKNIYKQLNDIFDNEQQEIQQEKSKLDKAEKDLENEVRKYFDFTYLSDGELKDLNRFFINVETKHLKRKEDNITKKEIQSKIQPLLLKYKNAEKQFINDKKAIEEKYSNLTAGLREQRDNIKYELDRPKREAEERAIKQREQEKQELLNKMKQGFLYNKNNKIILETPTSAWFEIRGDIKSEPLDFNYSQLAKTLNNILKKNGWSEYYQSGKKRKYDSSIYLQNNDGDIIRISDHSLPITATRQDYPDWFEYEKIFERNRDFIPLLELKTEQEIIDYLTDKEEQEEQEEIKPLNNNLNNNNEIEPRLFNQTTPMLSTVEIDQLQNKINIIEAQLKELRNEQEKIKEENKQKYSNEYKELQKQYNNIQQQIDKIKENYEKERDKFEQLYDKLSVEHTETLNRKDYTKSLEILQKQSDEKDKIEKKRLKKDEQIQQLKNIQQKLREYGYEISYRNMEEINKQQNKLIERREQLEKQIKEAKFGKEPSRDNFYVTKEQAKDFYNKGVTDLSLYEYKGDLDEKHGYYINEDEENIYMSELSPISKEDYYNQLVKNKPNYDFNMLDNSEYRKAQKALQFYTHFLVDNQKLRKGIETERAKVIQKAIDNQYTYKSLTLYRGLLNSDYTKTIKNLKVGDSFNEKAFSSTSYDKEVAERFMGSNEDGAMLIINTPARQLGVGIDVIGDNNLYKDDENEFLLNKGTFIITKKDGNEIYVDFKPQQVKEENNNIILNQSTPTQNEKKAIAIHNMQWNKLKSILKVKGNKLIAPSLAIRNIDDLNIINDLNTSLFGDIILVGDQNMVLDKKATTYSQDIQSPSFNFLSDTLEYDITEDEKGNLVIENLKTHKQEPFTPEKGLEIIKDAYKKGDYQIPEGVFEIQKDNISDYVKNNLKKSGTGYLETKILDTIPLEKFQAIILPSISNREYFDLYFKNNPKYKWKTFFKDYMETIQELHKYGLKVKLVEMERQSDGSFVFSKKYLDYVLNDIIKERQVLFQSAYHGSPYRFDKFTTDKIGTGEGVQAHGWGLYFALDKDVAKGYRNRLSKEKQLVFETEEYKQKEQEYIEKQLNSNPKIKKISETYKNTQYNIIDIMNAFNNIEEFVDIETFRDLKPALTKMINFTKDNQETQNFFRTVNHFVEEYPQDAKTLLKIRKQLKLSDLERKFNIIAQEKIKNIFDNFDDFGDFTTIKSIVLKHISSNDSYEEIYNHLWDYEKDLRTEDSYQQDDAVFELLKQLRIFTNEEDFKPAIDISQGYLFEVDIPEDNEMLWENKTFEEQPKEVKEKLINLLTDSLKQKMEEVNNVKDFSHLIESAHDNNYYQYYMFLPTRAEQIIWVYAYKHGKPKKDYSTAFEKAKKLAIKELQQAIKNPEKQIYRKSGAEIYNHISLHVFSGAGSPKETSLLLNDYGIKGIRYNGKQDGECAVVFDDKSIRILEFLQAQNQQQEQINKNNIKGQFATDVKHSYAVINLFRNNSDQSTLLHETMHFFEKTIEKYAKQDYPVAQQMYNEIKEATGEINDWMSGTKSEFLARGFEQYVRSGKYNNPILKQTYDYFRDFLLKIYENADELNIDVNNPKMYEFFDKYIFAPTKYIKDSDWVYKLHTGTDEEKQQAREKLEESKGGLPRKSDAFSRNDDVVDKNNNRAETKDIKTILNQGDDIDSLEKALQDYIAKLKEQGITKEEAIKDKEFLKIAEEYSAKLKEAVDMVEDTTDTAEATIYDPDLEGAVEMAMATKEPVVANVRDFNILIDNKTFDLIDNNLSFNDFYRGLNNLTGGALMEQSDNRVVFLDEKGIRTTITKKNDEIATNPTGSRNDSVWEITNIENTKKSINNTPTYTLENKTPRQQQLLKSMYNIEEKPLNNRVRKTTGETESQYKARKQSQAIDKQQQREERSRQFIREVKDNVEKLDEQELIESNGKPKTIREEATEVKNSIDKFINKLFSKEIAEEENYKKQLLEEKNKAIEIYNKEIDLEQAPQELKKKPWKSIDELIDNYEQGDRLKKDMAGYYSDEMQIENDTILSSEEYQKLMNFRKIFLKDGIERLYNYIVMANKNLDQISNNTTQQNKIIDYQKRQMEKLETQLKDADKLLNNDFKTYTAVKQQIGELKDLDLKYKIMKYTDSRNPDYVVKKLNEYKQKELKNDFQRNIDSILNSTTYVSKRTGKIYGNVIYEDTGFFKQLKEINNMSMKKAQQELLKLQQERDNGTNQDPQAEYELKKELLLFKANPELSTDNMNKIVYNLGLFTERAKQKLNEIREQNLSNTMKEREQVKQIIATRTKPKGKNFKGLSAVAHFGNWKTVLEWIGGKQLAEKYDLLDNEMSMAQNIKDKQDDILNRILEATNNKADDFFKQLNKIIGTVRYSSNLEQGNISNDFNEVEFKIPLSEMKQRINILLDNLNTQQRDEIKDYVNSIEEKPLKSKGNSYKYRLSNQELYNLMDALNFISYLDNDNPELIELEESIRKNIKRNYNSDFSSYEINGWNLMYYSLLKRNKATNNLLKRYYKPETIAMMENLLNQQPKEFFDIAEILFQSVQDRDEINPYYMAEFNTDMGRVDNYFPRRSIHESEINIFETLLNNSNNRDKTISQIETRTRQAIPNLEQNPLALAFVHIAQTEYVKNLAPKLKNISNIFNSDLQNKIKEKYGDEIIDAFRVHLQSFKDINSFQRNTGLEQFISTVIGNWAKGSTNTLSVFLKQLSSHSYYTEDLSAKETLQFYKNLMESITHPAETIKKMRELSPYIQQRLDKGHWDELKDIIKEGQQNNKNKSTAKALAEKIKTIADSIPMYNLTKLGDIGSVIFGGYARYQTDIQNGKTPQEALKYFERQTAETQQSGFTSLQPVISNKNQTKESQLTRLFRSQDFQAFNKMLQTELEAENKDIDKGQYRNRLFNHYVLNPLIFKAATELIRFIYGKEKKPMWQSLTELLTVMGISYFLPVNFLFATTAVSLATVLFGNKNMKESIPLKLIQALTGLPVNDWKRLTVDRFSNKKKKSTKEKTVGEVVKSTVEDIIY